MDIFAHINLVSVAGWIKTAGKTTPAWLPALLT